MSRVDNIKTGKFSNKQRLNFLLNILIFLLSIIIAISLIISFIYYSKYKSMLKVINTGKIYNNIFINDIDVGGLSEQEAIDKINNLILSGNSSKKIIVTDGNISQEIPFSKFEITEDVNGAVDRAISYAKEGSIKSRYNQVINLNNNPLKLHMSYDANIDNIKKVVSSINNYNQKAINAKMIKTGGNFEIIPGKMGKELNVDDLSNKIYNLLSNNKEGTVEVVLKDLDYKYKEDMFAKSQSLLGSFHTNISSASSTERRANIARAAESINGYIIYPEEVFSTNNAFGKRISSNGYKKAPIIVKGEMVDDVGGGICQVSSSLYMAALYSELQIVERQNHSLKVGYADYAYDATLVDGAIDLKIKNNTKFPVYIESSVINNKVIVNIYGNERRNSNIKLSFQNELIQKINPPAPITKLDNTLAPGTSKEKSKETPGYKYVLYKIVTEDGKQVSKEIVNTSYYKPKGRITLIGPAIPAKTISSNNKDVHLDNNISQNKHSNKSTEHSNI